MTVSATPSLLLDPVHLMEQTFGDAELERDVLGLFLEQCERLSPVIFGAGDPDARADAVHTLKGGARGIGAWRIADAAEAIEVALRRGGPVDLGPIGDALPATRDAILHRLASR